MIPSHSEGPPTGSRDHSVKYVGYVSSLTCLERAFCFIIFAIFDASVGSKSRNPQRSDWQRRSGFEAFVKGSAIMVLVSIHRILSVWSSSKLSFGFPAASSQRSCLWPSKSTSNLLSSVPFEVGFVR